MPRPLVLHTGKRDNNFNLLRMLAATAVLVSHSYPLSLGAGATEPLSPSLSMSLGTLAVISFFVISGFFISQSFENSSSLIAFVTARILRIYPALIVVLLLTAFVIGPSFTDLSVGRYFLNVETMLYVPRNISLKWLQYDLPGVFNDNPYPAAINGSLWTLFYEVTCYALVAAIGLLGLNSRTWKFGVFVALYVTAYFAADMAAPLQVYVADHALLQYLRELSFPFVFGMLIYRFRNFLLPHFSLRTCIGAGAIAIAASRTPFFRECFILSWGIILFYVGYTPVRPLRNYNSLGDYSYGMYIYAFPCEQVVVSLFHGISAVALTAVSFPITLGLAVFSWHFVEQPAMEQRKAATVWLERNLLPFSKRENRVHAERGET